MDKETLIIFSVLILPPAIGIVAQIVQQQAYNQFWLGSILTNQFSQSKDNI
jgi:hypothetical protein